MSLQTCEDVARVKFGNFKTFLGQVADKIPAAQELSTKFSEMEFGQFADIINLHVKREGVKASLESLKRHFGYPPISPEDNDRIERYLTYFSMVL